MQDRYVGDIGDFGKIALLSELRKQGLSIGINWYKTDPLESEKKNNDGGYIKIPSTLSECDPTLAKRLSTIAEGDNRSIQELEKAQFIPGAVYYSEPVPVVNRVDWHNQALAFFKKEHSDLVFLDPDNGLLVPSVKELHPRSVKYCFYEEVAQYIDQNHSVLVYNHRSRKPELEYFREIESRLHSHLFDKDVEILEITFPRYSIRDYFAIAQREHVDRIRAAFSVMLSGKWVESRMSQKPLTMGASYSEYRARFSSVKGFLRQYKNLPEDIVREMIENDADNSATIRACKYTTWLQSEAVAYMNSVYRFACKWIDKFCDPNVQYRELVDHCMADDCRELGFTMDCGNSFSAKYGQAFNEYALLKEIINKITDISILGSAVYSKWRYFNHWAYSADEILATDEKAWFILVLERLKALSEEN